MAKKSNRKKHQFKYGRQTTSNSVLAVPVESVETPKAQSKPDAFQPDYIKRDLVRVGMLAICFVLGELLLWVLFNYTALGSRVYTLV